MFERLTGCLATPAKTPRGLPPASSRFKQRAQVGIDSIRLLLPEASRAGKMEQDL